MRRRVSYFERSTASRAGTACASVEESRMERPRRTTLRCDLRRRYGDEIADIIAVHLTQAAPRAERPASQCIKARLQAIIHDPDAADLARIDSLTRALLMDPAWRRLRIQSLYGLTREQLAECARYALDHFPAFRKPIVERAEVTMTLALLSAARAWHAARRNQLLREALSLVFNVEYVRATTIIKKAHREWRAVTT